jgi:plastocyanin
MRTRERFTGVCSHWATLSAGAALGLMLGTTGLAAAPPLPPVGASGAQLAAVATKPPVAPRIEIKNHMFSLPTVTVPAGATVTWVNHDDDIHTVVSTTALFQSPGLDVDESYSYRFTKPGVYQYFCTLHPLMIGKVVVK